ncbi:anhydro-N-acetylmuramic acid kinase [Brackiella oedipodis]|uniref:anhydro-N-acetylmuramic acid kinase n=1 Tax=Brackiella oedipodis TaxID=124225 RepID=UPI00048C1D11|nr:anhydro-N-acetylmuramic acid kinase [Brackiella oedipodis]
MSHQKPYYIGLMSGTSTDAVDAVLALFHTNTGIPKVIEFASIPMPLPLRQDLLALNHFCDNELQRSYMAAQELTQLYAQAVQQLLQASGITTSEIVAIGAHGQTVRHHPELGFSVQLNAPALLAEICGIDVIADFRSRDIAAGGQGAPLVPAFHAAVFSNESRRALLNIGGIANLSLLLPQQAVSGFDTGPGNMLMDAWCYQHTGQAYDQSGRWGLSAEPNADLLNFLLQSEPWFALSPPKSTGRDLFNLQWLQHRLAQFQAHKAAPLSAAQIQATLRELTVSSICQPIHDMDLQELIVFGGGVQNAALMASLQSALPSVAVQSSARLGIDPQAMEALAFAWLAKAFTERQAVCTPAITGARHATIAGCLYPK